MLDRVAETISRYNMFERGHRVGVAVSGGADSVCLLATLAELSPRWALRLRVLHLNHKLRGDESEKDAQFVRELAEKMGLAVDIEEADLSSFRKMPRENLEQAARQARLEFFHGRIQAGVVDRVAVGHTLRDQAETVLFRLLRGTGIRGLAGILPVTAEGIVRPLLEVDRAEVRAFLRSRGMLWREDSSNQDLSFARNRIRHQLLPELSRQWNPALEQALARLAALAREEEEYWAGECGRLCQRLLIVESGEVRVRVQELRQAGRAAARRVLRRAIELVRGDLKRIEFRHIESVLELAEKKEGEGRLSLPGLEVLRSLDWMQVGPKRERSQAVESEAVVEGPGVFQLTGDHRRIRLELGGNPGEKSGDWLDWDRLPKPLKLRRRRAGDVYRPVGHDRPVSLKTLFQKRRVPAWERANWLVLEGGGEIVWVEGFGPAAEYLLSQPNGQALRVAVEDGGKDC